MQQSFLKAKYYQDDQFEACSINLLCLVEHWVFRYYFDPDVLPSIFSLHLDDHVKLQLTQLINLKEIFNKLQN